LMALWTHPKGSLGKTSLFSGTTQWPGMELRSIGNLASIADEITPMTYN
jgi:hypothetical protein